MLPNNKIVDGGEILSENRPVEFKRPLIISLIIACIFTLALGIGLGVAIFAPRKTVTVNPPLTENPPYVTPVIPVFKSKLATDGAMLQLKFDLENYRAEQDRVNLVDPQLTLPLLDLNITIE